jgi:hypothetical protein
MEVCVYVLTSGKLWFSVATIFPILVEASCSFSNLISLINLKGVDFYFLQFLFLIMRNDSVQTPYVLDQN